MSSTSPRERGKALACTGQRAFECVVVHNGSLASQQLSTTCSLWTQFQKLNTTQPAQQPVTLLMTLRRAENVSLCKHRGNKTQINPKVQPLSELSYLVSIGFIVQERAKSRSSHLTTQAFLHPESMQSSIRAEP